MRPLAILAVALLAAGCASADKPVSIVVQEDGYYTLDGQTMPTQLELRQALLEKVEGCRKAGTPLPKIVIQVDSPEKVSYEDLFAAVLACGNAELEQAEIEGVPVPIPVTEDLVAVNPPAPFTPAFAPIEIRGLEDMDDLRADPACSGTAVSWSAL